MKKKCKITFEISADYPTIGKPTKKLSKQFDKWFEDYVKMMSDDVTHVALVPTLFEKVKGRPYDPNWHQPNASVSVKVVCDDEEVFKTWWDQLSDDF
jgi:hypothetical protein